jgi:hypothetical protein
MDDSGSEEELLELNATKGIFEVEKILSKKFVGVMHCSISTDAYSSCLFHYKFLFLVNFRKSPST